MNPEKKKVVTQLCAILLLFAVAAFLMFRDDLLSTRSDVSALTLDLEPDVAVAPSPIPPPTQAKLPEPVFQQTLSEMELQAVERLAELRESTRELEHLRLKKQIAEVLNQTQLSDLTLEEKKLQVARMHQESGSKEAGVVGGINRGTGYPPDDTLRRAITRDSKTEPRRPALMYMGSDFVVVEWQGNQVQLAEGQSDNGLTLTRLDAESSRAVVRSSEGESWTLSFNAVANRVMPGFRKEDAKARQSSGQGGESVEPAVNEPPMFPIGF